MVVVDIQMEEAKQKENLPQPPGIRSESTKKPTAPVAPQPQHGTLHQSFNPTKICKPPMSVQKRIPPHTPVRLTQPVPGSMTKPIAPVAPQISETTREREIETARLTRRASNSSINSRISVASVESSSSSGKSFATHEFYEDLRFYFNHERWNSEKDYSWMVGFQRKIIIQNVYSFRIIIPE